MIFMIMTGCKPALNSSKTSSQVPESFVIEINKNLDSNVLQNEIPFAAINLKKKTNQLVDFSCSIDGRPFEHCESPFDVRKIEDGQHILKISARSGIYLSEKSIVFILDRTPPTVVVQHDIVSTISKGEINLQISGQDNESGPLSFYCKLDSNRETVCSNPVSFKNLSLGIHNITIRSKDKAGLFSEPFQYQWAIQPPAATCIESVTNADPISCGAGYSGGTKYKKINVTCPDGSMGTPKTAYSAFMMTGCNSCPSSNTSAFTPTCGANQKAVINSGTNATTYSCSSGKAIASTATTKQGSCTNNSLSCKAESVKNAPVSCGAGFNGGTKFSRTIITCPNGDYGAPVTSFSSFDTAGCSSCPSPTTSGFTPTCPVNQTAIANSGVNSITYSCSTGSAVATTTTSNPGTCIDKPITCQASTTNNSPIACGGSYNYGTKFSTTTTSCPSGPYGSPSKVDSTYDVSKCITDTVAPILEITNAATYSSIIVRDTATINFNYSDNGSGIDIVSKTCYLTPAGGVKTVKPCSNNVFITNELIEGDNLIEVEISDKAGNKKSNSVKIQADRIAPYEIKWIKTPLTSSTEENAQFEVLARDNHSGISDYEYQLDNNTAIRPLNGMRGIYTFNSLSLGSHTLKVRAFDQAGNASAFISHTWNQVPKVDVPPVLTENGNAIVLHENAFSGIRANEIFQRNANNKAKITLIFNQSYSTDLKYYSISVLNTSNTKESILNSGEHNSQKSFSIELATGLAAKKIRFSLHNAAGVEQKRWISPGFSVGEVFLVAGQSNSSTHGQAPTISKSILNRGVDPIGKNWVEMKDPLPYGSNFTMAPWSNPNMLAGSAWPSFADDLSTTLQVPVAVIMVGWGGSTVSSWLPGNENFQRLVTGASAVPTCGFRAVLWHQGESDAWDKITSSAHQTALESVASSFRSTTGCQNPWMIAKASYLHTIYWADKYAVSIDDARNMKWSAELEIRKAQRTISQKSSFLSGPDTDLVVASKYRHDNLHFSSEGLVLHGKLWSERVKGMFGYTPLVEADLIPEVKTIMNLYTSIFKRTPIEMKNDEEGLRYWVEALSTERLTANEIESFFRNTDEGFIRQVFVDKYNRQPMDSELVKWKEQLRTNVIARNQLRDVI